MIHCSTFVELQSTGEDSIIRKRVTEPIIDNMFYNLNFTIMDSSMTSAYEYTAFISFDFQFASNHSNLIFNLTFFELGRTESHMEIYSHYGGIYIYKNYVAGVSGDGTGMVHEIEVTSWLTDYKLRHTSRGEAILWRLTAYSNDLEIIISTDHINTTTIIPTSCTMYNTFIPNSGITDVIYTPVLLSIPCLTTPPSQTTIFNSTTTFSQTSPRIIPSGGFIAGVALMILIKIRKRKKQ